MTTPEDRPPEQQDDHLAASREVLQKSAELVASSRDLLARMQAEIGEAEIPNE